MAESGTYTFNPEIADLMREASERALVLPASMDYTKLSSIIRSANFVVQELAKNGMKAYEMESIEVASTVGMQSFALPARGARVFSIMLRRDGDDVPMVAISRYDYECIPVKDNNGRPNQYFEDDSGTGVTTRNVYIWPSGENTTDVFRIILLRRPMDVVGLAEEAGVAQNWLDVFCDGLAVRIAQKFNPQQYMLCKKIYDEKLKLTRLDDRERAPARFKMSQRYGRRGR